VWGNAPAPRVRAWIYDSWWDETYFPFGGRATSRTVSLNLTLDTNTLALAGTQVIRERQVEISFFHRHTISSTNDQSEVSFPLVDGNDGHWNLELNLTPHGSYLSGDAKITYANGEMQQFRANGRYSFFSDKTRLLLTSTWSDRGSVLWVTLAGPDLEIESLKGRVSGQKVLFP